MNKKDSTNGCITEIIPIQRFLLSFLFIMTIQWLNDK